MKELLKKLHQYRLTKQAVFIRLQNGGLLYARIVSIHRKKSSVQILRVDDQYETVLLKNIIAVNLRLTYQDELDRLGSLVQLKATAFMPIYQTALLFEASADASISPQLRLRYLEWAVAIRDLQGLIRYCRQYGKQLSDIIR